MDGERLKLFKCDKCDAAFESNRNLQRHLARKKPCAPIIDPEVNGTCPNRCKYCGRGYSRPDNLTRHLKACKIANSDEGMDRLMDYTIQRQLTAALALQESKIDELTSLVKQMVPAHNAAVVAGGAAAAASGSASAASGGTATVVNVTITPWDSADRIGINLAHVLGAFTENSRIREYARLGDTAMADPGIAPPYVSELLMDLTRRAHAEPSARNVYLNPRRSDQVLVHKKSGAWEVLPLAEATRQIFDGVAQGIHAISRAPADRHKLPIEAQNALAIAGMLYDDEPDEYARLARAPMMAHLENTAPPRPALTK